MLNLLVVLLAATAVAVPLSRRLGLGSILGYLIAGTLIGPHGLRLVGDVDSVSAVAELGIVMLLFLIGLEVRPQRLWVMRRSVFGLGAAQVFVTAGLLAALAWYAGASASGAIVLGAGFALSSTAIVLPMLAERNLMGAPGGRDAFAVLLFQDLAFIPLVALLPLLANGVGRPDLPSLPALPQHVPWREVGQAALGVAAILLGGRLLVPRAFRLIGGARLPEVFTAMALLIVVGTAALAEAAGLSRSLGAFMAGVLLSDSEFRHELRADIEPFEGLLLGFFFLSIGMEADLGLAAANPGTLAAGTAELLAIKIAVAFLLGRLAAGHDARTALRFALALPQGSEFSFVLFAAAVGVRALTADEATFATLVVAASMAATPLLFALSEAFVIPRLGPARAARDPEPIDGEPAPVIICGFGRVGQIVGRVLRMSGVRYVALDDDPGQIDVNRRFGTRVYLGNPARPDVLRAAGAEEARLLVVALDDPEEVLRVVEVANNVFPHLTVYARARDRRAVHLLIDRGVEGAVRDTFYSSLRMAEMSLTALGVTPEEAARAVALFAEHDERNLAATQAIYRDEKKLIQSAQDAREELTALFEADRPAPPPPSTARAAE